MKRIKVVMIGCGKMSKYIMRFVYEKNGEIVGAVDVNPKVVGSDIGVVMKTENKGIIIEDSSMLEMIIKKEKPDVAIIATKSTLNEIGNDVRICVKNGVNVITTCEEAFYPQNSNPILYRELDALAKAYRCTIIGCGYQDVFWGNMVTNICGSTHKITKIKGVSSYNVEDYGIALAKAHGAGLSVEDFDKEIGSTNNYSQEEVSKLKLNREFFPSYMWNVVGWLADRMEFHISDMRQECIPIIADSDIQSETLDMTIKKGMVRGMSAKVFAKTMEDILIEVECIGKVYAPGEQDINEWTVFGCPTTKVTNEKPATVELTCADVVNRIPSVLNGEKGFLTTSKMNPAKYIRESLNEW